MAMQFPSPVEPHSRERSITSLVFLPPLFLFFFFNDPAPPETYPLSLHDALPILDERAARNLIQYVDEQAETAAVPDDRTIVIERFRDELGDWRICVLTPWGARVHAPWGLAKIGRAHV